MDRQRTWPLSCHESDCRGPASEDLPALKWPNPLFSQLQPHSLPAQSEEIWRLLQSPEKNILSFKSSTKCRRNLHLDLNFQEQIFALGCWQGASCAPRAVQELWWELVDSMARKPTLLQAEHLLEDMFLNVQQEDKLKGWEQKTISPTITLQITGSQIKCNCLLTVSYLIKCSGQCTKRLIADITYPTEPSESFLTYTSLNEKSFRLLLLFSRGNTGTKKEQVHFGVHGTDQ